MAAAGLTNREIGQRLYIHTAPSRSICSDSEATGGAAVTSGHFV
jgi:hypothetical protein